MTSRCVCDHGHAIGPEWAPCPQCEAEAAAWDATYGQWIDFAEGHWTREPARQGGWYAVAFFDRDYGWQTSWVPIVAGKRIPKGWVYRWSVPLPEMPPVLEKGES